MVPKAGRAEAGSRLVKSMLLLAALTGVCPGRARAAVLPDGFQEEVVFTGLTAPTNIEFAPDGRVFVAEKSGILKVFDSLADPTPDILADLSTAVHNFWDRGLLGIAVDKDFPASPYVYVLYTYNFDPLDPGAGMPRWPDSCPMDPGATTDGCVVNGRLSRLEVGPGNTLVGSEQVLIENRWCQQFPSHSIGDLVFDDHERVLYASAGEGASFNQADYGQLGGTGIETPANPCGDPDQPRGTPNAPPTAEGGSLRSQDIRTPGDEVSLDGSILRIDPDTGLAAPGNPLSGGAVGDDPIIAHGLRNPFRMTVRPGTHEIWIGDVGAGTWEEINRIVDTEDAVVENFGWPCYEGAPRQGSFDGQNLDICENLYADVASPATSPFYAYRHADNVDPDPSPFRCSKTGSSSISGLAFYGGTVYPAQYQNALFFADYSRDCLFVMLPDGSGVPDPSTRSAFVDAASNPVDLEMGPDGMIYYADLDGGRIVRINYFRDNNPPIAAISANVTDGVLPLAVQFDGSGSSDPDPDDSLTYEWDLDGDGQFDDSSLVAPGYAYPVQGEYLVQLRVTDIGDESDVAQILITAGNTRPVVTIADPAGGLQWKVGDPIPFLGSAADPEEGGLPASALRWEILLNHCPEGTTECHTHPLESHDGVDSGEIVAPDHEWFSSLEFVARADDGGFPGGGGGILTGEARRTIDPLSVDLTFETDPPGLELLVVSRQRPAPFSEPAIVNSSVPVSAPTPQNLGGGQYAFTSWSQGGAAAQAITAPAAPETYTAAYQWAGPASDWWDPSWRSRQRLTIDSSGQASDLVDFPVLVVLDPTRIDYTRTGSGGADLRFVDDDAVTVLAHEVAQWVDSGTSLVWVKIPLVDGASTTDHLWIYYENPSAVAAADPSGVWSAGYRGVWHLDGGVLDSGPFANDGTDQGSTPAAGLVGGARHFDGASWIDAGNDASLEITGDLTLETWVRIDDPEGAGADRFLSKKNQWNSTAGFNIEYKPQPNHLTNLSSGSNYGRAENVDLDTEWHYVATRIEGTTATLWVDGVDVTTDASCDALVADSQALNFGRRSGGGDYYTGALDEIRVSGVGRTADYVAAQYLSMTDAYLAYGPLESNCAPSDATCDGFDDDCDGQIDEDVLAPVGSPDLTVDAAGLSWTAIPNAVTHRVVRGDALLLQSTGGDFAAATAECLADAEPGTALPYAADPAAGVAHWFLVRADGCGVPGTFDSAGPGQVAPRDAGIESAAVCP